MQLRQLWSVCTGTLHCKTEGEQAMRVWPAAVACRLTLWRILREVKNPGGADCVATKMGDDIADRVERKLADVLGDTAHAHRCSSTARTAD